MHYIIKERVRKELEVWEELLATTLRLSPVLAAFSAVIMAAFRKLSKRITKEIQEQQSLKLVLIDLLGDIITEACEVYLTQGWCPSHERPKVEKRFKLYANLGGNGSCKEIYTRFCSLPFFPPEGVKTPKRRKSDLEGGK